MKYFFFLRNLVRCHVPRLRVRRSSGRNSLLLSHQGSRVPPVSHHISGPGPDQYSCRQLSPSHCVHGSPAGRPKANILCSFTRGEFPFKSMNNLLSSYICEERKKSKLGKKILNIELVVSVILTICIVYTALSFATYYILTRPRRIFRDRLLGGTRKKVTYVALFDGATQAYDENKLLL